MLQYKELKDQNYCGMNQSRQCSSCSAIIYSRSLRYGCNCQPEIVLCIMCSSKNCQKCHKHVQSHTQCYICQEYGLSSVMFEGKTYRKYCYHCVIEKYTNNLSNNNMISLSGWDQVPKYYCYIYLKQFCFNCFKNLIPLTQKTFLNDYNGVKMLNQEKNMKQVPKLENFVCKKTCNPVKRQIKKKYYQSKIPDTKCIVCGFTIYQLRSASQISDNCFICRHCVDFHERHQKTNRQEKELQQRKRMSDIYFGRQNQNQQRKKCSACEMLIYGKYIQIDDQTYICNICAQGQGFEEFGQKQPSFYQNNNQEMINEKDYQEKKKQNKKIDQKQSNDQPIIIEDDLLADKEAMKHRILPEQSDLILEPINFEKQESISTNSHSDYPKNAQETQQKKNKKVEQENKSLQNIKINNFVKPQQSKSRIISSKIKPNEIQQKKSLKKIDNEQEIVPDKLISTRKSSQAEIIINQQLNIPQINEEDLIYCKGCSYQLQVENTFWDEPVYNNKIDDESESEQNQMLLYCRSCYAPKLSDYFYRINLSRSRNEPRSSFDNSQNSQSRNYEKYRRPKPKYILKQQAEKLKAKQEEKKIEQDKSNKQSIDERSPIKSNVNNSSHLQRSPFGESQNSSAYKVPHEISCEVKINDISQKSETQFRVVTSSRLKFQQESEQIKPEQSRSNVYQELKKSGMSKSGMKEDLKTNESSATPGNQKGRNINQVEAKKNRQSQRNQNNKIQTQTFQERKMSKSSYCNVKQTRQIIQNNFQQSKIDKYKRKNGQESYRRQQSPKKCPCCSGKIYTKKYTYQGQQVCLLCFTDLKKK